MTTSRASLVGKKFTRWTVLAFDSVGTHRGTRWMCVCDCGTEKTVDGGSLAAGRTRSCGCLQKELASIKSKASSVHGMSGSYMHRAWSHIKGRCNTPTDAAYGNYGGRGIKICAEWNNSFSAFMSYVSLTLGDRPSSAHTIDRIDNDTGYLPGNIRWADKTQQARNTRQVRMLTFAGQTRCISAWAEITGIRHQLIGKRLNHLHWPVDKALSVPPVVGQKIMPQHQSEQC